MSAQSNGDACAGTTCDASGLIASFGLTKREEFAARAMQGMLASETDDAYYESKDEAARHAVLMADALLRALEQEPTR